MKGIVFTEFFELVEEKYGLETVNLLADNSELGSKGVYTRVRTYDYKELYAHLDLLSKETGVSIADLIMVYGNYLFQKFTKHYPQLFENIKDSFELLEQLESFIHIEVQKLYPDAELPSFEHERISENELLMTYTSGRGLASFAHALILGAGNHFNELLQVEVTELQKEPVQVAKILVRRGL